VAEPLTDEQVVAAATADYVTFTSSSTVRFLMQALDGRAPRPLPARRVDRPGDERDPRARHGLTVAIEAERHDVDGPRGRADRGRRRG